MPHASMNRYLDNLSRRPAATGVLIERTGEQLGARLPGEYIDFLKLTNGAEGFVGPNSYVMLWCVEELAELNQSYEVQNYVPGLLLFGSDGGGEAYGFDMRNPGWPIVQVPFIGMAWDVAQPIGSSFVEFLERLYKAV